MKKLLPLLTLLCFSCQENYVKTDLEVQSLKGIVMKFIELQQASGSNLGLVTLCFLNSEGMMNQSLTYIIRDEEVSRESTVLETIAKYEENKKLVEIELPRLGFSQRGDKPLPRLYFSDVTQIWESKEKLVALYEHDGLTISIEKRLDEQNGLLSDTQVLSDEQLNYHSEKVYYYNDKGELSKMSEIVYDDQLTSSKGNKVVEESYLLRIGEKDDRGNIVRLEQLTDKGEVVHTTVYEYEYFE